MNDDCQDGFKCGTDNCQSDFGWLNGDSSDDCCEAIEQGVYPITDGGSLFTRTNLNIYSTVDTGCGYTYLVEEQRDRQCGSGSTSKINIDGWVDSASATTDGKKRLTSSFVS